MTKTVLVTLAPGTDEIEAITVIDVLRRAGMQVTIAAVGDELTVNLGRGVKVVADKLFKDVAGHTFDLIVLPGGIPGAENLAKNEALVNMLHKQKSDGRHIGAICASPKLVLQDQKIYGNEHEMVAYPSFMEKLATKGKTKVCTSGKLVTSVGPASSMDFALKLVEVMEGKEKENKVKDELLVHYSHALDDIEKEFKKLQS